MRSVPRLSLILLTVLALSLPAAESASAQETSADLQTVKTDSPDPVPPGGTITYDIVLTNAGPDDSEFVTLEDTLPAGTTFVSFFSVDPAWTCTTPAVGSGGTVSCSIDLLAVDSSAPFTLTVAVDSGAIPGTMITNTAMASSETFDPVGGNNDGSATTTVASPPPGADLSVTKVDDPDPVTPGANLVYTITVNNAGPDAATNANLVDALPPETTFVSLSAPGDWTCTTPAVGTNDTVICSIASLGVGSAVFTLTVAVGSGVTPGTEIFNSATVSSNEDPDEGNNNGSASTTVTGADLSITKVDTPDPVLNGGNVTYTITVTNAGPSTATAVNMGDLMPGGTNPVSLTPPPGWSCTPPVTFFNCAIASLPPGSAVFTLILQVGPGLDGTQISNTVTVGSSTADPNTGDNMATATTTVTSSPATLAGTKTVSGTFTPGGAVTYTVVVTNGGPNTQGDNLGNEFTDVLPASLTLVSATANSGTATATVATNTVTWNGSLAAGASVTITINAVINAGVAPGTTISNQGTIAFDADGNGTNEASAVTDDPATAAAGDPTSFQVVAGQQPAVAAIPTLDTVGLALLVLLLAMGGAWALRRKRSA